ncbi:MAG TPA: type II toxin-antitoxin system PrlF family antitoxin [Burkholderiaceae bacterium]|jgi:AbrB family looped-hinge helix DNA binding protein|nr:type II toxin-antitoxin system PrlF family antitoxin [Burkholderiaceae bacterium]
MTVSATSRLTEKYQATIPLPVRRALRLDKGDRVAFEIRGGEVILRRATPLDVEFARAVSATLSEWASRADERAYADL